MKILFTFLVFICLLTTTQAQDIVETLSGNTASQAIIFKSSTGTTLFKVRGDGNVGIGTSIPGKKLDISVSDLNDGVRVSDGVKSVYMGINSGIGGFVGTESSDIFIIRTEGFNKIYVHPDGTVGILDGSPDGHLEVNARGVVQ